MQGSVWKFLIVWTWIGITAVMLVVFTLGSHAGPISIEYHGGEAVEGGQGPAEDAP